MVSLSTLCCWLILGSTCSKIKRFFQCFFAQFYFAIKKIRQERKKIIIFLTTEQLSSRKAYFRAVMLVTLGYTLRVIWVYNNLFDSHRQRLLSKEIVSLLLIQSLKDCRIAGLLPWPKELIQANKKSIPNSRTNSKHFFSEHGAQVIQLNTWTVEPTQKPSTIFLFSW